jgi:hypothetical protein
MFMNGIQDLVSYSIYVEFHFLKILTVLGSW